MFINGLKLIRLEMNNYNPSGVKYLIERVPDVVEMLSSDFPDLHRGYRTKTASELASSIIDTNPSTYRKFGKRLVTNAVKMYLRNHDGFKEGEYEELARKHNSRSGKSSISKYNGEIGSILWEGELGNYALALRGRYWEHNKKHGLVGRLARMIDLEFYDGVGVITNVKLDRFYHRKRKKQLKAAAE